MSVRRYIGLCGECTGCQAPRDFEAQLVAIESESVAGTLATIKKGEAPETVDRVTCGAPYPITRGLRHGSDLHFPPAKETRLVEQLEIQRVW